ncbi:MAG: glycosyltransferase [Calditrichaeota bacterium]|nr:MAG: glycosyltransferase [Calditrichota bacterium]
MKITLISTAYPLRGGIAQYTGILYRELQKKHEVNVITFKRQYPKFLFPGKTQQESSKNASIKIESEAIIDSINPMTWLRVFLKIKKNKPDLIIFKYWMPFFAPCFGTITWLTKRFTTTKILYICDNVMPHERRPGDRLLTRFALGKADFFIVQSNVVKNDLLELLPNANYKKVAHPVYDIFGKLIEKNKARKELGIVTPRVILFFGFIRAYKGLDLLLEAMPEILKNLELKLLVVGEFYEDEQKYRQLIDKLGIADQVIIHSDFVPNENVYLYFSAADVVVLPYKSATQSGIVPLAYHFNKPCIVTDVGGLSEVVLDNKTGFVVEPNDPVALAQAVIRFYREGKEARFMENINKEKKKYSWENLVEAIEELASED